MRVLLQTGNLMLLLLSGVFCSNWKVEYRDKLICAVKGSTVSVPCSFYSRDNQTAQTVWWGHVKSDGKKEILRFRNSRKAVNGFQYIGDKLHNCSLKIGRVENKHAGKYLVIFNKAARFPVEVTPIVKVTDLTISMSKSSRNEALKEGDSVNLTCVNSCDDSNASSVFTWFKNGESTDEGPFLHFKNMSPSVSGNYACSLKRIVGTISRAVHIDVEYSPKNTSLTVRPPGPGDAGNNFTLICSSNANPPVENYTWFKTDVGKILSVGHHLMFHPADGGQYFCCAANKHGSDVSSIVVISLRNYGQRTSIETIIFTTLGVFLVVITIILVIRIYNKRPRPTNTVFDEDTQNTDVVNWRTGETTQSPDVSLPERTTDEVCYATVVFPQRTGNM